MFRNLALAGLVATGAFLLLPAPPGGRLVKIYGYLKTAGRVAVIVPGADTTVRTFDDGPERPGGAALRNLTLIVLGRSEQVTG